eukprot:5102817-Pyramimonas_sp.AAC.1
MTSAVLATVCPAKPQPVPTSPSSAPFTTNAAPRCSTVKRGWPGTLLANTLAGREARTRSARERNGKEACPIRGGGESQSDEGRGYIPKGWTNRMRGEGIYLPGGGRRPPPRAPPPDANVPGDQ